MMKARWWWLAGLALVAALALAGCKAPEAGTDALSLRVHAEYGGGEPDCNLCHASGSPQDPASLDLSVAGGKHPKHVDDLAFPCQTCHAGYFSQPTHMNGKRDATDPSTPVVGFQTPNDSALFVAGGNCANTYCHDGFAPHWYTSTPWVVTDCKVCHYWAMGDRRIIAGPDGDFRENTAITSGHVPVSTDPAVDDPAQTQCGVCHDVSTHRQGQVRLAEADGGAAVVYDPADASTLEPFCLSCHDALGATVSSATSGGSATDPFNEAITMGVAPYPSALTIDASWAKTYGHGPNGGHAPADQLTCTDCHGRGGAVNAHGAPGDVMTRETYAYGLALDAFNPTDFALCFNCHANYPGVTKEDIFGVKQNGLLDGAYGPLGPNGNKPPYYIAAVTTQFADHNETGDPYGLNDANFFGENFNLHWFHFAILGSDYRGTGTSTAILCSNCHSVHGSNTAFGSVHDALVYTHSTDGTNTWGNIGMTLSQMGNYPTYCGFNCHGAMGPTKAWFDPITE
jgi:hypothetical protein